MSIEPTTTIRIDVLAGHVGHLTETQEQAFAAFRQNLTKAGLYVAATGNGATTPASHDDSTLL